MTPIETATATPVFPSLTPTPVNSSPTSNPNEVIIDIGNKQTLTINIVANISATPSENLLTPTETILPTQTAVTATPTFVITVVPTVTPETASVTPTSIVTNVPSVTPIDYSNEINVEVGSKGSLTILIGEGSLTPSPSLPPVSCTTDSQCPGNQKCDLSKSICADFPCPTPPNCNDYVKINHQCILVNLADVTSCIDTNNNTGFCYSGVCSQMSPTPIPSETPTPTITPTPVVLPTEIPVDPTTPRIRFSVKLFGVATTPDIKVRLKATDLVAWLTPAPQPVGDSCKTPGEAEYFFSNIVMSADSSGVYRPKLGTTFDTSFGLASVSNDGWIPLVGLSAGKSYALSVKGPIHRNRSMESNLALIAGQSSAQDLDWTSKLLEPGDLPDPNNNLTADCTINSIDLSLIESRIANTDSASLNIADVNYDAIINGNDISKVVNTLYNKPDDD